MGFGTLSIAELKAWEKLDDTLANRTSALQQAYVFIRDAVNAGEGLPGDTHRQRLRDQIVATSPEDVATSLSMCVNLMVLAAIELNAVQQGNETNDQNTVPRAVVEAASDAGAALTSGLGTAALIIGVIVGLVLLARKAG